MPLPEQDVVPPSARPEQVDLLRLHEELPVDVPGEVAAELDRAQRRAARDLVVNAQLGFQLVNDTASDMAKRDIVVDFEPILDTNSEKIRKEIT